MKTKKLQPKIIPKKHEIKLKPTVWTKHHTHRVLHVSGLIIALAALLTASGVFGTRLAEIQATDTVVNDRVGVTVAAVGVGPTVEEPSTTSGSTATAPSLPPGEVPVVEINNSETVFNTQYPHFTGHTNIKNAVIHLLVESKYTVTSNVYANSSGDWEWTPLTPIMVGNHTLTVTATDPLEPKITARTVYHFQIKLPDEQNPETPTYHNTKEVGNGGNLFDVIVSIPEQFKVVKVGDELVARIKFVNFGSSNHPVDVESQYIIRNAEGKVISQSSQTVAVATQLAIIKSFYTNKDMAPGVYTLTVSVPSENLVATATDTFTLKEPSVPVAAPVSPINYTLTLQVLGGMIFLFTLIAYLEYNKVELISTMIKQVTEADLLKQN